ncbi:MAG: polymer-forming cytoskeletal protein [Comamonadaceae bacterium]|nr:MAG: polymer-forming cytoskeletal protein [Comamonadaceae bacterium]
MTAGYLTYMAFALVCLLLLTVPFIPAVREWRHPTDLAPLPVSANYTSDIDHFARRLHADVAAKMGEGPSTGYGEFELVAVEKDGFVTDWEQFRKRLIVLGSVHSETPLRAVTPVYVRGSLRAPTGSMFSALYANGDIRLGAESVVDDWVHADGLLVIGDRGIALRRASAGSAILLGRETWFERLQAPALFFGQPDPDPKRPQDPSAYAEATASFLELPHAVQQTANLFLVRGNCSLPPGLIFHGSLVVTGFLVIGEGTTVLGDVKAREGASIGPNAQVLGAVTCEKRIYVFAGARALGPVMSETDILIGGGATVGTPDLQTTVTARNIIAEPGSVVHGSVWAHEIGMVKTQ